MENLVRMIERLKYNAQTYQSPLSQSEALTTDAWSFYLVLYESFYIRLPFMKSTLGVLA